MSLLFVDDDNRQIAHPFGMRPSGGASGIVQATMSASTQELVLPTGGTNIHGQSIYRIVGTQPILYALDKAAQGGSYTSNANMVYVPANVVEYFRADTNDAKVYVLQGGTAGTVQVTLMT